MVNGYTFGGDNSVSFLPPFSIVSHSLVAVGAVGVREPLHLGNNI